MPVNGNDVQEDEVRFFTSEQLDGYQCSIKAHQGHLILVMQEKDEINSQLPANMYMTLLYLLVAGAVIYVVVYKMTTQIIEEHKSANTDALTELQNRRAYELTLKELQKATPEQKKNVTYISMDANGLKNINDHYGHDAGDAVITGVADCIRLSFGDENAYRIGGDEYAILYRGTTADLRKAKAIFEEKVKAWNERHPFKLSISAGYVDWAEYPESDIMEVCKLADFRMYMEKEQYYSEEGHDRRKNGPGN
jgi:diguanylate cyclase (GGDEF)-like protein